MTRWIRFGFALLLCATVLAPPAALAHPVGRGAPYVVHVEDQDGRPLRTFHHQGKTFVMGEWRERYVIRIANHTGRRVEAVVSVDGRDVVSGRMGDYVNERGYLIGAWDEVVIEGFRQSHDQVAAFRFTNPEDSYSSRMGTPENVGIIGVAFFPEAERRVARSWWSRPRPERIAREHDKYGARMKQGRSSAPCDTCSEKGASADGLQGLSDDRSPARRSPAPQPSGAPEARALGGAEGPADRYDAEPETEASVQNLGTEYGESLDSHVRESAFRRAAPRHPAELVSLYYDDRDGLLARGIRVERPYYPVAERGPRAFPNRFAPPPP